MRIGECSILGAGRGGKLNPPALGKAERIEHLPGPVTHIQGVSLARRAIMTRFGEEFGWQRPNAPEVSTIFRTFKRGDHFLHACKGIDLKPLLFLVESTGNEDR